MADKLVASSIRHIQHLAAFDLASGTRLDGIDITPVLVYNINTVPVAVLLYLAEQFDVMGAGGWDLADTELAKRTLIKGAIELHRRKGTPWAVKEAIRRVGYQDVTIIEHVSLDSVNYDGVYNYDGTQTYGGGFWADFRIKIFVPDAKPLGAIDRARIAVMVEEYKNVRSRLVDITFALTFADTAVVSDDTFDLYADPLNSPDYMTAGLYFNGLGTYNGASNYDKGADPLELKIYQNGDLISTEIL